MDFDSPEGGRSRLAPLEHAAVLAAEERLDGLADRRERR